MAAWPGGSIGTMQVRNFHGGTSSHVEVNQAALAQQEVDDAQIDFSVDISYSDHPWFDNGVGSFSVQLSRMTTSGWEVLDTQSRTLGNDNDDGDWSEALVISTTMTEEIEQYQLVLRCGTGRTSLGTHVEETALVKAVQGQAALGDLTLDFVPLTIVYSPPGPEMWNSLTQSLTFGTRFTLGQSSTFKADTTVEGKVDVLGIVSEGFGVSQSQTVSNQSSSVIQVSHFRTTVVTADNQRAIGPTHWGPLGDLFVIMVNPKFAMSKRADGTIFYSLKSIQQIVLIPAWKLLRPGDDPVADGIPADVRRRLLELDPFIRNLDMFFPDAGEDLAIAANSFADPSGGNRAEMVGRWWLEEGSMLGYSEGQTRQLVSTQTNEVKFESKVTMNLSAGVNVAGLKASLGVTASNTIGVGLQQSSETTASASKTAACQLIHKEGTTDVQGIDVFYDKIFSTFMFRRVRRRRKRGELEEVGASTLKGRILSTQKGPIRGIDVCLRGKGGDYRTSTTSTGGYEFVNLEPGAYTLEVGDQREPVEISEDSTPEQPQQLDLSGVKRSLDLRSATLWEVQDTLGLPTHVTRRLAPELGEIRSLSALAKAAEVDREVSSAWSEQAKFTWPRRAKSNE